MTQTASITFNRQNIEPKVVRPCHLVPFLIVVPDVEPRGQKYMRRLEVPGVPEGAANNGARPREHVGRVALGVINFSAGPRVHVRVQWRHRGVVQRERDVEEALHVPAEGQDAIAVHLWVRNNSFSSADKKRVFSGSDSFVEAGKKARVLTMPEIEPRRGRSRLDPELVFLSLFQM